jgi:hypothetical protein
MIGPEKARTLVEDNPLAVINGEALIVDPPIPFRNEKQEKRGFFSRLFQG